MILENEYETADGVLQVVDFMPVRESVSDLVRIVTSSSVPTSSGIAALADDDASFTVAVGHERCR